MNSFCFFYILLFNSSGLILSFSSTDTITATNFLKDPSSLNSDNGVFKLGFIAPPGSTKRYVAIWYDEVSEEIVWVANRNSPLTDSSGELKISKDGNIELLNSDNRSIWSSSIADSSAGSTARLLNSGNFVLMEPKSGTVVWQSFDHPVASFLPGMKLTFTKNPNSTSLIFLRSWKSNSDPSEGRFSVGIDTFPVPQIVIREEGRLLPHWRSGPWNGNIFIGIEDNINFGGGVSAGFILATDRRATMSLSYTYSDGSSASFLSNYALNPQGTLVLQWWDATNKNWEVSWNAPQSNCDAYNHCGAFASCNPKSSEACKCFRGFEPKNKAEWSRGNWTNGCLRRTKLQCGGNGDGFWTMNNVKVPDKADWVLGLNNDECRGQCLSNCSCLACMYDTGVGCLWWSRDLVDTVKISDGGGLDLNVRLAGSDLQEGQNGKVKIIGAIAGVLGIIVLAVFVYMFWRRMSRKQDERTRPQIELAEGRSEVELEELPLYGLEKLVIATNNFDTMNKLGQGGFGPVYKGTLEDGQQIAIKRLSRASGQGLQEFMNEVVLISKLQHRNLVRLLGCCVEANEKMLIYEYMPNKSLDAFLFDPEKQHILDWTKRFSIIQGICRGLLYLHRDSRLKIIHRDLKASNILLDEDHNPKISDFGMARISGGGNQEEENTKRIVGTYGYMAPEYAMEGKFSIKSDVFSFGVLLLEIVSGRKNARFSDGDGSLSLLQHAWGLWNENKLESLIDPKIAKTCIQEEFLKCVRVGLLCVQDLATDRPSISRVLFYLGSENADIPSPKSPGFILRGKDASLVEGSSTSQLGQQQMQSSSSYAVYDYEDETTLIPR